MQNRWKKEIWDRLIHSRSNDTRQKCLVKIQPVSLLKIQTVRTLKSSTVRENGASPLFGEKPQRVAARSNAGRPRVSLRVLVSLLYLKHAFNESDEGVVQRWADTPRWQFFSGQAYYEDRPPGDATTLVKFRQLLGDEGVEELLAQTLNVAVDLKLIKSQELSRWLGALNEKARANGASL